MTKVLWTPSCPPLRNGISYYRGTQIPPLQTDIDNTSPLESISAILNGPVVVSVDTSEYAINPAPLIP